MRVSILVILLAFVISCAKPERNREESFNSILNKSEISQFINSHDYVLVIPNAGCEGCISNSEQYVRDHVELYSNLSVVFTGVQSKKILKNRIGEEIYHHKRVMIDDNNAFYNEGLLPVYPFYAELKNGIAINIKDISPENPFAFDSLTYKLLMNK